MHIWCMYSVYKMHKQLYGASHQNYYEKTWDLYLSPTTGMYLELIWYTLYFQLSSVTHHQLINYSLSQIWERE